MWRRRAHWVERKNGWVFTSDAPAREPIRRSSSFIKSLRMRDLQRLEIYGEHSTAPSAEEGGKQGHTAKFAEHRNALETVHHREEC